MNRGASAEGGLVGAIMPHIDFAIKASPCTCASLRPDVVLDLSLKNGFGPDRISRFLGMSRAAKMRFLRAISARRRNPALRALIDKTYHPEVPISEVPARNVALNSVLQECGLAELARECEEIAVSYTAVLRYLWPQASKLMRSTWGVGELDSMANTMRFCSTGYPFVSTSLTRSPWFVNFQISYIIRLTDAYRKCAVPLTYTSVFAIDRPETLCGFKEFVFFEDEVRIKNGTPIEPGTVDVEFRPSVALSQSQIDALAAKYASLGRVWALRPQ